MTDVTDLLGRYVHRATTTRDPTDALELAADLAREAAELRDRLAVELVLDHGQSYAEVGRRLGVSRQAAHDAYASEARAEMHRRIRR